MRIVIDLQEAQTYYYSRTAFLDHLRLIQSILESSHPPELIILLNGLHTESISSVRTHLKGFMPKENIITWYPPEPSTQIYGDASLTKSITQLLFAKTVCEQNPDWVLTILEKDSNSHQTMDTLVAYGIKIPTAVIYHSPPDRYLLLDASAEALQEELALIKNDSLPQTHFLTLPLEPQIGAQALCSKLKAFSHTDSEKIVKQSKPKLAYLSPLPPEQSGIAYYSVELLEPLQKYYDIEIISAGGKIATSWIANNLPIRNIDWFEKNYKQYDRILYHFGNSHFHQHMFNLLPKIPGVVVLHDFFLSGLISQLENIEGHQGLWQKTLYHSHGYKAAQQRFQLKPIDLAYQYPCNLSVLQQATGVIVHSAHSRELAEQWYGPMAAQDWAVIPLLRTPVQTGSETSIKQKLGLPENAILICSFGTISKTKLNHRLLQAFSTSALSKRENVYLILVGEQVQVEYEKEINQFIQDKNLQKNVWITGYVDDTQFRHYLMAADIAVQLRAHSRGESSAAVLDCMNHGLATIVNAHGSMAELPTDSVIMLADPFTDTELAMALEKLCDNQKIRTELGKKAQAFVQSIHHPNHCTQLYREHIERFYKNDAFSITRLVAAISIDNNPAKNNKIIELSNCLAKNFPPKPRLKQLFVDVSAIAHMDLKTGIQRVVRSQLLGLIASPPAGFRIEPVYLKHDNRGQWHYHYAYKYMHELLELAPTPPSFDPLIDFYADDVLYMPDLASTSVIFAHKSGLFRKLKTSEVTINVLVHDLLPITHPTFFPPHSHPTFRTWLNDITEFADKIICVSQETENQLKRFMFNTKNHSQLITDYCHHGADINASTSIPETSSEELENVFKIITSKPSFLVVGTVEPRKGHQQILEAFDRLWAKEKDICLIIVGKHGWMMDVLANKIKQHPELDKHLFWLEGINDTVLSRMYTTCTALIMASLAEGFGLPLIEAAQHNLPIISRDIPIFREVAGEHAYYFSGLAAQDLALAIEKWLDLQAIGKAPLSTKLPWLTWSEQVEQLKQKLSYEPNIS